MSKVGPEGRSFLNLGKGDLKRLLNIAERDREEFFRKRPDWARLYANRILCVALCQGAALHYVTGTTGINDFDVWTFFETNPKKSWCYRRNKHYDFGDPKFGQSIDRPDFNGRRVDCLGRDIKVMRGENSIAALQRYLKEGGTETSRLLAEKPVVLLEPDLGRVVSRPATAR